MALRNVIERGRVSGLDYLIVGLSIGHRCGYVRLPEGHPWHDVSSEDEALDGVRVHGGVTFCGELDEAEGIWLGFDCAHSDDARDPSLYDDEYRAIQAKHPWPTFGRKQTIRTTDYVRAECKHLAEQIAEKVGDLVDRFGRAYAARGEWIGQAYRNGGPSPSLMLEALKAIRDRDRWRQECWAIYLATGADPDGADPRHLNPGEALRAVEELREKCDLAYDAGHRDACNAAAEADRG